MTPPHFSKAKRLSSTDPVLYSWRLVPPEDFCISY